MGIVSGVLDILAAILAIMVVKEIDQRQTESATLIPGGMVGPQPPPPPALTPAGDDGNAVLFQNSLGN